MGIRTSRNYLWSNQTVSLRNWHLLKWALDNYLFSVLLRYLAPFHFSSHDYSAENANQSINCKSNFYLKNRPSIRISTYLYAYFYLGERGKKWVSRSLEDECRDRIWKDKCILVCSWTWFQEQMPNLWKKLQLRRILVSSGFSLSHFTGLCPH